MPYGELTLNRTNPLIHPRWNDILLASEDYSIFHTSNWAQVLNESYRCQPYYFTLIEGDKFAVLVPVMELTSWITGTRGICLPFSDYCYPLVDGHIPHSEVFPKIMSVARELNWRSVEIRGGEASDGKAEPSSEFNRHILSLEAGEENIFSKMRSNYRSKVRKAVRNDLNVEICRSAESLEEYYRLHCMTRRRHGLPIQPAYFFKNIYEHIIARNLGIVVLASHKNRYVAGSVFFHFGKKALYKFGALDKKYQHLQPSYLVMWHAIQWYSRKGYTQLCFGRTDTDHEGLNQFKDGWGSQRHQLNYYTFGLSRAGFVDNRQRVRRVGYRMFNKMPAPLLKIAGHLLYKHIG